MTTVNILRGVLAKSFPAYVDDFGTGRCRITTSQFLNLKISIGWILRLKISSYDHRTRNDLVFTVLCTAWPDTREQLSDDLICLDISSITQQDAIEVFNIDWIECTVQVSTSFTRIQKHTSHS